MIGIMLLLWEFLQSNRLFNDEIDTPLLTSRNDTFDIVFSFAVLHHIPSIELRLQIIQKIHEYLEARRNVHPFQLAIPSTAKNKRLEFNYGKASA